jgi:NAD(P)-dependent dehydrogenase (short-subunit alcohol dehydrogenase family)
MGPNPELGRTGSLVGDHAVEPASEHDAAPDFGLHGRVAVVTGGSRGLGLEMCRAFARQGAAIVVASRKIDACEAVASELASSFGVRTLAVQCHVGRWEDCERLVDLAYGEFGHVDVLVNNAGMSPLYPSLVDVTEDLFDKVIAVNLKGPFRLSCLIGERMQAAGRGSIINISSIAAVEPAQIELPYAAAKAGLNVLTIGLAKALGPQVRVNAIMPGAFLTDISENWNTDGFAERARRTIALQRAGLTQEIAGAALYFASDASSYTSGAILKIDGGRAWAAA